MNATWPEGADLPDDLVTVGCVKQMLLRVPDDLHARLAARAAQVGQSMNTLATQILDTHTRAAESRRPVTPERRRAAIEALRVGRPVLDDLLADGR
jgi:plasmid stability protein